MQSNERTFKASSAAKLDDPARLVYLPPAEAASRLNLAPGQVVADIGAGSGYFSIPFAGCLAPGGRVYAVDFQPEMLAILAARLKGDEPIEARLGAASETGLPDSSCDIAFLAMIWHELDDREAVLAECRRVLRPSGRVAILDWRGDLSGPPGPPEDHRVRREALESLLSECGWHVESAADFGPYAYLVVAAQSAGSTLS